LAETCDGTEVCPPIAAVTSGECARRGGLALALLVAVALPGATQPSAPAPSLLPMHEPVSPVPALVPGNPLRIALGEALFSDPRLSLDGKRSCMGCHDLATNGASGVQRDLAPDGHPLALNTNTVFNAALSYRLDWAGGERSLEEQARVSLTRPDVMAITPEAAATRLAADPGMVRRFRDAYGRGPDAAALLDAVATFERTLVTPGSPFDRWLAGDADALAPQALQGWRLFKALGCVSCHQGVNIGSNLYQVHGLFRTVGTPEPRLLRVPSLRNVATSPPYFHDGSAPTLEEAVHVMAVAQLGHDLPNAQAGQIVAFLNSLTGTFRGHPVTAPAPLRPSP